MNIAKILIGTTLLNFGVETIETIKYEGYYDFPKCIITANRLYTTMDHTHYEMMGIFEKGETTMSLTGDSTGNYYTTIVPS
jgi:hypothetical protein